MVTLPRLTLLLLLLFGTACEPEVTEPPAPSPRRETAPSPSSPTAPSTPSPPSPASKDPAAKDPATKSRSTLPSSYNVPEQTEQQVSSALRSACQQAKKERKRLLVEFSAPWCGDCQRLHQMLRVPALARALSDIPHVQINIGRFDHHEALLEDFSVRAIANWHVLEPTDCQAPPKTWKRVAQRTLERRRNQPDVTPEELSGWLKELTPSP